MNDRLVAEELAEQYEACRTRIAQTLAGISPEQESTIVPACPDWTVRDLLSHNAGLAAALSSGTALPTDNVQQWVDDMVASRAETSVARQLEEWASTGPAFASAIRADPSLGRLLNDIVAHEHDFAHALGIRGDRDSRGIELCMDHLKPNSINRDLAAHGLSGVILDAGTRRWRFGDDPVELTVRATMFELYRLTGGRRSRAQLLATDHEGDMARYLPGLVHLPLAEHDLFEGD